jgi:N-acetylglucosaminyldiphosphoundecaprenol N-acetyl-beta-D-mannosaminyltransferase
VRIVLPAYEPRFPSFRLYTNGPRSFANFTGVRVEALTFDELGRRVVAWTRDKSGPARHIGIINAHNCALAIFNRDLRDFYNSCDIAGPDSMPFVHLMRLFYRQRTDRIYGPDVLWYLFQIASLHGLSFYFYGGTDDVLKSMIDRIKQRHPDLKIVGYIAPPFRPLSEEEDTRIWSEIVRQAPDIICVGLGAPKQDYFMALYLLAAALRLTSWVAELSRRLWLSKDQDLSGYSDSSGKMPLV